MKIILITGGTGMLGTNLQKSFKNRNLNGFFIGRGDNDEFNLLDYEKTKRLFSEIKPSIVIHAAANVGGIGYNIANPGTLIRDNLKMGINILDACVEFEVSNLYITSTCCAYPKTIPMPMKEDDLWNGYPEQSNSGYGIAKKTIMKMSQDYRQQFGLKSTTFILANLYGLHDNFDPKKSHVMPALIRKFCEAKRNNFPTVECWGTGSATRSFLFSEDLANCLSGAVDSSFDYHLPINLAPSDDISIRELAYLIAELTGYQGTITFSGGLDGQPKRLLDVSRAAEMLNWRATTNLTDGLKRTIEWYKESLQQ